MSTRVSSKAQLSPQCSQQVRQRLSLRHDSVIDLGTLSEIMATGSVGLETLREMISAKPVSSTLAALAPAAFERSRALLAVPVPVADVLAAARSAQAELEHAIAAASAAITAATKDVTADVFAAAGKELGYAVSVCRGAAVTGIEMRRGHEVMLVRVSEPGTVETDQAGLVDGTCADRQRELERAVVRRGIVLTDREQQHHGSASGGNLIKAAAARRDPSLARAVVLAAEPSRPARRGILAEARDSEVRRPLRKAGGRA